MPSSKAWKPRRFGSVWSASGLWRNLSNLKRVWYDAIYIFVIWIGVQIQHTRSSWLRLLHASKNLLQWRQWPRRFEILQPLLAWKQLLVMGIPMMMVQKILLLWCLLQQSLRNQVYFPGKGTCCPSSRAGCVTAEGHRTQYVLCITDRFTGKICTPLFFCIDLYANCLHIYGV